jgi:predicted dehydrogenase
MQSVAMGYPKWASWVVKNTFRLWSFKSKRRARVASQPIWRKMLKRLEASALGYACHTDNWPRFFADSDIDPVIICVPSFQHRAITRAIAKEGLSNV